MPMPMTPLVTGFSSAILKVAPEGANRIAAIWPLGNWLRKNQPRQRADSVVPGLNA